ncbi:hypothetical protein HY949_01430 [Candidatus Gottesmanbacteria bacterium]|nr:hypothetical protein [Candidatus Gottesmanbacteria bacterium]
MAESFSDALPRPLILPDKQSIIAQSTKESPALAKLTMRAQESSIKTLSNTEQNPTNSASQEQSRTPEVPQADQKDPITQTLTQSIPDKTTKRTWWKNLISKPIP